MLSPIPVFVLLSLSLCLASLVGCARQRVHIVPVSLAASPPTEVQLSVGQNHDKLRQAYIAAVDEAKYPQPWKISKELLPILKSTEDLIWNEQGQILMTTWTSAKYYDKYRRGKAFSLSRGKWFTAAPVVQKFCQEVGLEGAMLELRLKQLLGLPPDACNDAFLQVWINPENLFRPCPDPEITDHECQVEIPLVDRDEEPLPLGGQDQCRVPWDCKQGKRQVSGAFVAVHEDHLQWMCKNWKKSYCNPDPAQNYPWTALGYTYDWGDPSHRRGPSEFVALSGTTVVFHSVTSTEKYCAWPKR